MFSKITRVTDILPYTPPKLHSGKNWYVDFYCVEPLTGALKRKKIMLDGIPKIADRRKRAAELIHKLTIKLAQGWNPWCDTSHIVQYSLFSDVVARYRAYLDRAFESDVYREKTYKNYVSKLNRLAKFVAQSPNPIVYIYQLDQPFLSEFLEYIFLDCDASARTRNNYKGWLSSFCAWLVERRYIQANPMANLKNLRENGKIRDAISPTDLSTLKAYLHNHNQHFLLACMFEYYCFIRPAELSRVRLSDISIKNQSVLIPSSSSKNRRDGLVGLNATIIKLMADLEIFKHPSDYYLFGKEFSPSHTQASSENFRRQFNKIRATLRFPSSYQFYSLKDSGIRDLANAEGVVVARDQARHTDVSTTNAYLKGDSLRVQESTKTFEGAL